MYAVVAVLIGTFGGIFEYRILRSNITLILPFTMFLFPALLEEAFFRGVLIPRSTFDQGIVKVTSAIVLSSVLFVMWHPVYALLLQHGAQKFFFDPWFLVVTFLLGVACGTAYVTTRSLWVPIIMHWLTVVVWVLFLGGWNFVNEVHG